MLKTTKLKAGWRFHSQSRGLNDAFILTAEFSNVAESVRVRTRFSPVFLSSTAGQMAVGGNMCSLNGPKSHSGLTWDAHRL